MNKSRQAALKLHNRAIMAGIAANIIEKSKGATRRYSANGSTHAQQKIIVLNGVRMSVGQAKQYITAREG